MRDEKHSIDASWSPIREGDEYYVEETIDGYKTRIIGPYLSAEQANAAAEQMKDLFARTASDFFTKLIANATRTA